MTRIEEIISNALAGIEETEVAILARELLKTREALALAQQAKGDAEGRAAMADRRAAASPLPGSFGFGAYMDPLVAEAVRASDCNLAKPRTPTWRLPGSSPSLATEVQEIQAGAVSSVDRFASCPKNEPCTPAVVVTDLTPDDCLELDEILQEGPPYNDVIPKLAAWICEHARAIPANRVAVDREELKAFQELLAQARCAAHAVEDDGECDMTGVCGAVLACDALRANQGGPSA